MKSFSLRPITKDLTIKLQDNSFQLSPARKFEIEEFWQDANQYGAFQRGEVFHVESMQENENECLIQLVRSDYAHYLHTVRNHIKDNECCRVVYGAGLVETHDCKLVFGEMGEHTAYPNRLQCVGGGLSKNDLENDRFNLKLSVLRELSEELGVNFEKEVASVNPMFIKSGGTYDFLVVLFHIQLSISSKDLMENYENFIDDLRALGEEPEFKNIYIIENNKEGIQTFLQNNQKESVDYLLPLLEECMHQKIKESRIR